MLLRLLGLCDLLTLVIIFLTHLDILPWRVTFVACIYLIGKGVLFWGDFTSFLDMICGVYVFALILGFHSWVTYVVLAYLAQKIFFTMT